MFTDGEEVAIMLTMPMLTERIEVIDYGAEATCGG